MPNGLPPKSHYANELHELWKKSDEYFNEWPTVQHDEAEHKKQRDRERRETEIKVLIGKKEFETLRTAYEDKYYQD